MFRAVHKLEILFQSASCWALFRLRGVRVKRITCEGRLPKLVTGGEIDIGGVSVRGSIAPCELGAVTGGRLRIGRNVFINQGAIVVSSCMITVEDDVRIGDFAAVYDTNFHAVDASSPRLDAPVVLETGSWVGRSAIVLPGVTVGAHSVVAAGSVVMHDVPPATLVAGVPARVVRELDVPPGWVRS
jgi:acetyltransferase-like isoleucine patch superfamily enzyme